MLGLCSPQTAHLQRRVLVTVQLPWSGGRCPSVWCWWHLSLPGPRSVAACQSLPWPAGRALCLGPAAESPRAPHTRASSARDFHSHDSDSGISVGSSLVKGKQCFAARWLIPIGFRSLDAEGRDQNPVSPPAARQNVHLALAVRSSVQEREQGGGANQPPAPRHAPRAREQAGPRLRTAQRAGRPVPREQALRPQQVRLPGGEGAGHPHCRLKAREGPRPERLALGRPRPPQFQRRLLRYLEHDEAHTRGWGWGGDSAEIRPLCLPKAKGETREPA